MRRVNYELRIGGTEAESVERRVKKKCHPERTCLPQPFPGAGGAKGLIKLTNERVHRFTTDHFSFVSSD
jgi:hypothetical protein